MAICHPDNLQKKGGGEDEKENEEELLLSHPSRSSGLFFSSSPAALDALLPPGSYSGKRDTDSVAHKLPTGLDCIKVTPLLLKP